MYTRTCARSFDISCYYGWVFSSFTTDRTDWTDECPVAIKEIKKFVAFPRLTPLQPDAYAQP